LLCRGVALHTPPKLTSTRSDPSVSWGLPFKHIKHGFRSAYQEPFELQGATVLEQAFSSLHETIQDPGCSLQGGGTGTGSCFYGHSIVHESNWADPGTPTWSQSSYNIAAASAVLQQETTTTTTTQQDQPSTSGRSKLTTEEWRAKYEKDGAVDLFLVDHFNAAMVVSWLELRDAIAVPNNVQQLCQTSSCIVSLCKPCLLVSGQLGSSLAFARQPYGAGSVCRCSGFGLPFIWFEQV
jgi:hypothetical protein